MIVAALLLGWSGLNGSSLGLYATDHGATDRQAGVLAGPPRPIRSDEWLVRTPWVLRQLEHGLPDRVAGGIGVHEPDVLYELPTSGWEVILRPPTAAYRLFGPERAFAFEWWAFPAIQMLGVYALLLTLTRRIGISALAACLVTLSPVTQWWTMSWTFTTIGYGSLATALVLSSYRARTARGRVVLSLLGGATLAAFLATLYPPWQIGVALILVPVALGSVVADLRVSEDRKGALRRLLFVLMLTIGLGGVLFTSFLVVHRDAVDAMSSTVYPGRRSASVGGGTDARVVLSAAFDYFASEKRFTLVNGTNQSENSSALPLLLPVGAAFLALVGRRRLTSTRTAAALVGCLIGGGVVAAWMFLPIPAAAGRLLLLTKVPPPRLLPALGLAGVIALVLFVSHQLESGDRLSRWQLLGTVAMSGAVLAWGARIYSVEGVQIDMTLAGVFIAIVLVGLALALSGRPVAGFAVLTIFSLFNASFVNPIQDGLAPLTESPLRKALDSVQRGAPADAGWIGFSVDHTVKGTMTAAGLNNLSGISPYPDRAQWGLLDPGLKSEDAWNRYAHVSFLPGGAGSSPTFTLRAPDDLAVTVDPCSPLLRRLGARFVVTQGFEIGSCLSPVTKVAHGKSFVMVYRY